MSSTVLRVGTHNVRSLTPTSSTSSLQKAQQLATFWNSQKLDIIFVQEHKITNYFTINSLRNGPLRLWKVYFNQQRDSTGLPSCAILIRRSLIMKQLIKVKENSLTAAPNGRLLSLNVTWGGHNLQLACMHLPNVPGSQREFINTYLVPLATLTGPGGTLLKRIWGGDFNFVHNPSLDRIQKVTVEGVSHLHRPTATTSSIGTFWSTYFPQLLDIYRLRHPTSRDMSRFDPRSPSATSAGSGGSARLDRFYISAGLVSVSPSSRPCTRIVPNMTFSDHLLVTMDLVSRTTSSSPPSTAAAASTPPRSRKRLRYKIRFQAAATLLAEYEAQLANLLSQAPSDERQLLDWYPRFKRHWVNLVGAMNQRYWDLKNGPPTTSTAALQQAFERLGTASNGELSTALEEYTAAHSAHTAAAALDINNNAALLARFHINQNECPNKNLTRWIAPLTNTVIHAIKGPSGILITNPVRCATIFAKKFAAVSSFPNTTSEAKQQVLTQLEQSSLPKIALEDAAALGNGTVTTAEVELAIKKTRPGTAPGPDGIPIGFYHLSRRLLAPMLAKVYSATHALDDAPKSFSLGAISPLYKLTATEGDATNTECFRPITLLDIDYRILAKVLATRMKPLLPSIIHPHQSAFIQGRNISDCNWLPQFLAPLLKKTGKSAAILLCDIAKAYDTVDRDFLWQIMALMGVGNDFLRWVKLLHRNTRACAFVRGYRGDAALFLAGVRQGCPLAALLFLFVTHALLLFLEPLQVGVKIREETVSTSLYADDLRAFAALLANYQCPQASQLLDALTIFGNASNLRPSIPKLQSLLIGMVPEVTPPNVTSIGAFKLVSSTRTLGLHLSHATGSSTAAWELLVGKFKARCKLLSQCGLSMFGRCSSLSAYCNSIIFYAAEFSGLPAQSILDIFASATSRLINLDAAPSGGPARGFYGIKTAELAGHPTLGGFGLIPIESHITARHAKACIRLLVDNSDVAWIRLGRQLLALASPPRDLVFSRLAALSEKSLPYLPSLPSPLSWLLKALHQLPPLIVDPNLEPGPWCYSVPLWDHTFLVPAAAATASASASSSIQLAGISLNSVPHAAGFYSSVSKLQTIGDALVCYGRLCAISAATNERITPHQLYTAVANDYFGPASAGVWTNNGPSGLPDLETAKPRLKALLQSIRSDWLLAARSLLLADENLPTPAPKPSMEDAVSKILNNLGWKHSGKFLPVAEYTVKWGTLRHFETTAASAAQLTKFKKYVLLADPSATNGNIHLQRLYTAFKRAWSIRWDRKNTQMLWQLAHDALPTAQRLHSTAPCSCCTSVSSPGLIHHYWECSVAVALRNELLQQLSHIEGFTEATLQRHHLWLLESPLPTFFKPLWPVVALAALNAMDSGRRTLFRLTRNRQSTPVLIASSRRAAIRNAIAAFWKFLAQFAATPQATTIWSSLTEDHPFLHWNTTECKLKLSERQHPP